MALALAAWAAGCGADLLDKGSGWMGGEGGTDGGASPVPSGGPLATAGPDRRALAGSRVLLDGRGSSRPEDGRSIAFLWTQEAGPRVALDDASATVASFVAPPRNAREGDRLVFRLLVGDGSRTSLDRVAVEIVDRPEQLVPAPIALGGADQEVLREARVTLPAPAFVDPACDADCAGDALPFCWTQVEGTPVIVDDPCDREVSFVAPASPGVLTFRLDAHRGDGTNRAAACRPDAEPGADRPFCAAPDYVRVFVRDRDPRRGAPSVFIDFDGNPLPRVGPPLVVDSAAANYPRKLTVFASHRDPSGQQTNSFFGYRPIVGEPPLDEAVEAGLGLLTSEGMLQALKLELPREPSWPRTVGVAFEAQYNRVRAAPAALVVSWRPPAGAKPPIAQGVVPCGPSSDKWCGPFVPGDVVTLRGLAPGHPDPDALESCWEQLSGPAVSLEPAPGCMPGLVDRSFVAPPLAASAKELPLSFRFYLRDGGPLSSAPDVVVARVAASVQVPAFSVAVPEVLSPGMAGLAKVVASPRDLGLAIRWRQVWTPPSHRVQVAPLADCTPPGSCVSVTAPAEAAGHSIVLEAIATDVSGSTFTRRVTIPIEEGS
ncbi:MAG TPA: hypothetical protein VGD74_13240 [Vulgatibacter sp.]